MQQEQGADMTDDRISAHVLAAMLGLAVLAGIWSKRSENVRSAALVLGAVVVFALVSYGVAATRLMLECGAKETLETRT